MLATDQVPAEVLAAVVGALVTVAAGAVIAAVAWWGRRILSRLDAQDAKLDDQATRLARVEGRIEAKASLPGPS